MSRGSRSGTNHVSPVTLLRVQISMHMKASLRALRLAAKDTEIASVKNGIAQMQNSNSRLWFEIAEKPTWLEMVGVTCTFAVVMAFGGACMQSDISCLRSDIRYLQRRIDYLEKKSFRS